jgi:ubiquinone/menaquinone biosynthesis C-methylase UbiE
VTAEIINDTISNNVTDTIMEDQVVEYNDNLEPYLQQIGRLFDIQRMINEPQEKPQIINYYVKNKLTYKFLHNWGGFIHFGISYDGRHKKEDLKEQARIVEGYIHDRNAKNVLELAYGMGASSAFLACRNPGVTFDAVDLSLKPLKRFTKISNLRFQFGDYHDLGNFEDNAYDIVFVIEALCHSTNKLQVLREVKKKLKRDGLFIVIDVYQRDRVIPLNQSEDIMLKLIAKGVSVDKIECVKDVERYMQEEYSITVAKDYSQYVLPSMIKLESLVSFYLNHPAFAKAVNKLVPFDIVKNAISVFLLPTSMRRQIGCYYIHVLKNDT